jgi:hypothetical protein
VNLALPATRPPNKTGGRRHARHRHQFPELHRRRNRSGPDPEHHCYVNEEGLLDNPQHFFMLTDGHQPLAGNGIILASTEDGDEAPCRLPLEWVKERVTFMDFYAVRRWCQDHDQGESASDQLEPNP